MPLSIIWHPFAKEDLKKILLYCRSEFGRIVAAQVRGRILQSVNLLSNNPRLGVVEDALCKSTSLEYRSILVRQTKIVYSVHSTHIYIHLLWNTYKDPQGLFVATKSRQ